MNEHVFTPETIPRGLPPGGSVIVGMSGGVDSSVAARLLIDAGFAVRGLFMKNWEEDDGTEYCTALRDFADAADVCDHLGIELLTANFAAEYWDNVFESFLHDYRAGRTPNPDVLCNREIKFKHFAAYAESLGADAIATGHYVRGVHAATGFELHKGVDQGKDQSYFLQAVTCDQFSNALFPLGALNKTRVRQLAKDWGFGNHRKKDSTGICFIGERRFRDFLEGYVAAKPGIVTDPDGHHLGEHDGLAYYTLGQRQGLGIGGLANRAEAPWYVCAKDTATNTLVVTQSERDLMNDALIARAPNWLVAPADRPSTCTAKVRYRQADQRVSITPLPPAEEDDREARYLVRFAEPQRAITPGQHVCFYNGSRCLGGAVIEHAGERLC